MPFGDYGCRRRLFKGNQRQSALFNAIQGQFQIVQWQKMPISALSTSKMPISALIKAEKQQKIIKSCHYVFKNMLVSKKVKGV